MTWELETLNNSHSLFLYEAVVPSQALAFLNSFAAFEKQTYGFWARGMKQS